MKPRIIQDIGDQLAGCSHDETRKLIDNYLAEIVWALEKDEWDAMSEDAKAVFVVQVRTKKSPTV